MYYFLVVVYSILFLFSSALLAIQKEVVVGFFSSPPYKQIDDQGETRGLVLDILTRLKPYTAAGYKIKVLHCPLSRCLKMMHQEKIDILGDLIKTPQREQTIKFVSPPYMALSSSFVFYANRHKNIEVNNYEDLIGKRIAVMRGAAYFKRFDKDHSLHKVPVINENIAVDLVIRNRVDLVINVEDTAEARMNTMQQATSELQKMAYQHSDPIYGYMGLNRTFAKTPLGRQIQSGMVQFAKSGQLNKIVDEYQLPPVPNYLIEEFE